VDAERTELLHTALFDTGSELVDHGLVDSYEHYYLRACGALITRFTQQGFTQKDALAIHAALRQPGVIPAQGGMLVHLLECWLPQEKWPSRERTSLLSDPDPHLRIIGLEAATSIGPDAAPDFERWRTHLKDPHPEVRYTAVQKLIERRYFIPKAMELLGECLYDNYLPTQESILRTFRETRKLPTLPLLLKAWREPTLKTIHSEIHRSIIHVMDFKLYSPPPKIPPERRAEIISALLDSLKLDRPGIRRHCKEALGALPVHATLVYLWAIRPDGTVLCVDHEAFGCPYEVETNPVSLFAAYVHAAELYPELAEAIPRPDPEFAPCTECFARGETPKSEHCFTCSGMGWRAV
jgi:hypothetical protein